MINSNPFLIYYLFIHIGNTISYNPDEPSSIFVQGLVVISDLATPKVLLSTSHGHHTFSEGIFPSLLRCQVTRHIHLYLLRLMIAVNGSRRFAGGPLPCERVTSTLRLQLWLLSRSLI